MNNNKFPVIEKLRAWFYRQPSKQQLKIKKWGTVGSFIAVALGVYYLTGQDDKTPPVIEKPKDVTPAKTESYIQDDIVTTLNGEIKNQAKTIDQKVNDAVAEAIKSGQFKLPSPNQMESLPGTDNADSNPLNSSQVSASTGKSSTGTSGASDYPGMSSYPEPTGNGETASTGASQEPTEAVQPQWLGGITEGTGDISLTAPEEGKTEKKNTIQLPVGFMKAKLLVGVNALTGEFGAENPQTIMLRVQTPAQLPNFIKMNLRGCFSIANVTGNLSTERIHALPVSMHCMTMDGHYIVEGDITGFVSDRDGKRDISARIVSRAGRLLASTVFAKSIEGFAGVIGNQSIQQNVSPLGSINTVKPGEATKNAAATGVAGGFTEVSKYLLNLAQQTSPALETGPGKDVMLFVQKTAELEIKEVRIK